MTNVSLVQEDPSLKDERIRGLKNIEEVTQAINALKSKYEDRDVYSELTVTEIKDTDLIEYDEEPNLYLNTAKFVDDDYDSSDESSFNSNEDQVIIEKYSTEEGANVSADPTTSKGLDDKIMRKFKKQEKIKRDILSWNKKWEDLLFQEPFAESRADEILIPTVPDQEKEDDETPKDYRQILLDHIHNIVNMKFTKNEDGACFKLSKGIDYDHQPSKCYLSSMTNPDTEDIETINNYKKVNADLKKGFVERKVTYMKIMALKLFHESELKELEKQKTKGFNVLTEEIQSLMKIVEEQALKRKELYGKRSDKISKLNRQLEILNYSNKDKKERDESGVRGDGGKTVNLRKTLEEKRDDLSKLRTKTRNSLEILDSYMQQLIRTYNIQKENIKESRAKFENIINLYRVPSILPRRQIVLNHEQIYNVNHIDLLLVKRSLFHDLNDRVRDLLARKQRRGVKRREKEKTKKALSLTRQKISQNIVYQKEHGEKELFQKFGTHASLGNLSELDISHAMEKTKESYAKRELSYLREIERNEALLRHKRQEKESFFTGHL